MSSRPRPDADARAGAAAPVAAAPTRVGVISLGCAKNLVDTEVMLGHLEQAGCTFVGDPAEAEVIVVNTCGFIEPAREESVQTILEAAELKKSGRLRRLIVAGCMVQRYRAELAENLPEVDAFVGLDELAQVVDHAREARGPAERAAPAASGLLSIGGPRASTSRSVPAPEVRGVASRYLYDHATPRHTATAPWTAFVKIAEGCDHTCAFCAIPGFRGAFRSRDPESVVRECESLALRGVREVNLIAQDTSHYGRDRGGTEDLASLLSRLDRITGLRWIRVHYLYPNTVTKGLIRTMAECGRVVPYVDMPLQHADPAVLRRMRRGGSAASHLELLARFRAAIPRVTLRTTFIVGFPGETEAEFESLLDFVRAARFDHVGVFVYSHEDGTPAAAVADDVPAAVKEERRARLMDCQRRIVLERNAARLGRQVEVLVEGAHPETEHLLVGRTAGQAPEVDGSVIINEGSAAPGSFVSVELTETAEYDLIGRIVGGSAVGADRA